MPSFVEQGSFGSAFEVAPRKVLRWFGLAASVLILRKMWDWSSVLVTSWALILILIMILGASLDLDDWSSLWSFSFYYLLTVPCLFDTLARKSLAMLLFSGGPFVWSSPWSWVLKSQTTAATLVARHRESHGCVYCSTTMVGTMPWSCLSGGVSSRSKAWAVERTHCAAFHP